MNRPRAFNMVSVWQQKSTRALLLANLVPLVGVIFFGWSLYAILFSYWAENAVIGFFNLLKMWQARGPVFLHDGKVTNTPTPGDTPLAGAELEKTRYFLLPFFVVHYGGFMAGHFYFLFSVLPVLSTNNFSLASTLLQSGWSIALTLVSLLVSHGVSYFQHFIQGEEYKKTNVVLQMFAPYKRIFVMHITIIVGAFVLLLTGGYHPVILILFILIKIWVDTIFHQKSHRWAEAAAITI